jgi:hypothetical protein
MKTMVAFAMALITLVLATTGDADAQNRPCLYGRSSTILSVRAGTPCWFLKAGRTTEIIERPHEGTAVIRGDGRIYYSPRPGFSGRDRMRVRRTDCDLRNPFCFIGETYIFFVE